MTDALINQAEIDAYNASEVISPNNQIITSAILNYPDNPGTPAPPGLVQAFNDKGELLPDPQDLDINRKANFDKAFAGGQAQPEATNSSNETITSYDIVALKQKGYLQEKGFFGDQSMTNENKAFNNAASVASAFLGESQVVKSRQASLQKVGRTNLNFYLYDNERMLLQQKALEYSAVGIIPYDVLEQFLYILVTIDNSQDLKYIGRVIGIIELDNPNYVRAPIPILTINNLYRISYLANAVASINMQYSTKYNALNAADHTQSSFYNVKNVASTSIAASVVGTVLNSAMGQFPIVNIAKNLVGDIISQIGLTTAITGAFPNFGSLPSIGRIAQIASLATVTTQLGNLGNLVSSTISTLAQAGVSAMNNIISGLSSLVKNVRNMLDFTAHVGSITQIASTAGKITDVASQMTKISSLATGLMSAASTILGLVNSIVPMGNIGLAASVLTSKLGGMAPSGIITELTLGQRIPPSVLYKNPMMQSPSYSGKAFFGEAPCPQAAIDQTFCRKIAAFPKEQNGSGTSAFGMQNFGSFGGETSLSSMVARSVLGVSNAPPIGTTLGDLVATKLSNLCNILNVPTTSTMEARRSDHSIPYMTAMSAVHVDDTNSPFPADVHADSWKLAASVGNEVQRYNPGFLSVCSSSL